MQQKIHQKNILIETIKKLITKIKNSDFSRAKNIHFKITTI